MILQYDDAQNIIALLDICGRDHEFRQLVEEELKRLGLERNLTKKTRDLITKGVWASIGMSLNYEIEESHTLEDSIIDEEQNTEELVMSKLTSEKLFESVFKLPPIEREVVIARYGLKQQKAVSYKDIASLQQCSISDIMEREEKALKTLRMYMSDEITVDDYKGAVALLLAISWDDRN